jgi:hypothetical protein
LFLHVCGADKRIIFHRAISKQSHKETNFMKRSTFLLLGVVGYLAFGLGLLLVPAPFMSFQGVSLDAAGSLMARVLGSALIGMALIFWWVRNAAPSDALLAILRANLIYNILDIPVIVMAIFGGAMGVMGWSSVLLHLLYGIGFAYFGFVERQNRGVTPATRMGVSL